MIYKDIEDFPTYEISVYGDVRNKNTKRVMKNQVNKQGYYSVSLWKCGKPWGKKIHRLIAQHYLKPPSEDLIERCKTIYPFMVCINHKDGINLIMR